MADKIKIDHQTHELLKLIKDIALHGQQAVWAQNHAAMGETIGEILAYVDAGLSERESDGT